MSGRGSTRDPKRARLAWPLRIFLPCWRQKLKWGFVTGGVVCFSLLVSYGFMHEHMPVLCAGLSIAVAIQFMAPLPVTERGAACHEPGRAIPLVEALIRALEETPQVLPEPAPVLADLCFLLERLREAQAEQARFCLLPSNTWSGLIEANLGLYL